jgi:hypothetical protein
MAFGQKASALALHAHRGSRVGVRIDSARTASGLLCSTQTGDGFEEGWGGQSQVVTAFVLEQVFQVALE